MKLFKNILLVSPLSEQLIDLSVSLMSTHQSRLTLMTVAPKLEKPKLKLDTGGVVDLERLMVEDLEEELQGLAETFQGRDFHLDTVVAQGLPFLEIIRQVIERQHDVVMMQPDGFRGGVRDQLLGTLSMHLMRKCPSPVWIAKPERRKKLRNIFAAVDPDPTEPVRQQLNIDILTKAQSLAQLHGAQLHVIHAWDTLGGDIQRSRRFMSRAQIRLYVEQVAREHRERLQELVRGLEVKPVVHLLQGLPGEVIPRAVQEQKADLLVMGTVCRTGVPGFFIGNTAEMMLGQVDCSVLTLKPRAFVSPIHANLVEHETVPLNSVVC